VVKKDICQKSLVSRAKDVYRDEGLAPVSRRAGAKIRNILFRSNAAFWFARDLVGSPVLDTDGAADEHVPGMFSLIAPGELAKLLLNCKGRAWAVDPRELSIASRLKHQWTCWRLDGEIVAFCKVGRGRVFVVDFERPISLPDNLAFLSDVYVFPHARKKGIGRQLLLATMNSLVQGSVSVLSCHIPPGNTASTRLFVSLGFRPFGQIRFIRIMGLSMFSRRPEAMLETMTVRNRKHPAGFRAF
jgi:ribosomal protein S18 acetylase RimI-like enzyme